MRRPETETEDKAFGMRSALIGVAVSAAVLTTGAFVFFDGRTGVGVLFGGVIATANLWIMARLARAFIAQKGRAAPWAVVAGIKLAALLAGVWLVLRTGAFSPIALVVGYGALPLGITLGSLFGPPPDDSPRTPLETEEGPPDSGAAHASSGDGIAPPRDVVDGGPPKTGA